MIINNLLENKIVMATVVAFLLSCVSILILKKRAKKKQLRQLAEDRKRDEMLDVVLLNAQKGNAQAVAESIPYEVDYMKGGKESTDFSGKKNNQVMIHLVEHNELSQRKHIISPGKGICIGSSAEGNVIVISEISAHQCEIFKYKGKIYLRDIGEKHITVLKRKKKMVYAEENGIRLQTGDKIILGKIYFDVAIIE